MKRVVSLGIIGFGTISQALIDILRAEGASLETLTILVRPTRETETQIRAEPLCAKLAKQVTVTSNLDDFLACGLDLVVECAGCEAVEKNIEHICKAGVDVVLSSVGALSNPDLYDLVTKAAAQNAVQIHLPAGAIGGIDVLSAVRHSGITSVLYTGRKPPRAWAGTCAEERFDLELLAEPTVIFEGSAREAARAYPKNANVAATLALAGIGMDETKVRLIADPGVSENIHEYNVVSAATEYEMRLIGKASAQNPKTSLTTVYSLARVIMNQSETIVI